MHKDLAVLRQTLNISYAGIAQWLEHTSGGLFDVSGNTIRRWFRDNEVPIEIFMLLLDKTKLPHSTAFRVYPWMRTYFADKQTLRANSSVK